MIYPVNNAAGLRDELLSQGYCVIGNVIPRHALDRVREEVHRDVWAHSVLEHPKGYVPGFLRFNQSLAPYLAKTDVLGFAESLFGPHVRISMFTGSINAPGLPRGPLHSDWPFNQRSRAHIPAPYSDQVLHLVTFWMLTDFTVDNGATIVVPGSHTRDSNPTAGHINPDQPQSDEARLVGSAGSVAVVDARVWHAEAPNQSDQDRVAVIARYAPWWLNLDPLRPGTIDHEDIVERNNGSDSRVPPLPQNVYERLPAATQSLFKHSVAWDTPSPR